MVVTLTAAALAAEIGATEERATRLLAVATEAVTRYAPNAPEALANEATIRFAGYLAQSDYGTIRTESIGPMSVEYVTNHAAMFRNSGAEALLTRFKRRRAGAIGANLPRPADVPGPQPEPLGGGTLRGGAI